MLFVYRIFTQLANLLLKPAGFFIRRGKTAQFIHGRLKPLPLLERSKSKRYWFHCASLGEFEQARPLIEKLKAYDSELDIVVSFFSPSGYTQRFDYELARAVVYLPIDTPFNASRFIEHIKPDAAVFVKYEIWYYQLSELFKKGIPVYMISAVFRAEQFLFNAGKSWLFPLLQGMNRIFVQDKRSLELLLAKGLDNVVLSGDTRYDRVKSNALKVKTNPRIEAFKGSSKLLVLGSSWPEEERLLVAMLDDDVYPGLRIMIAPHDVSEAHIENILERFKSHSILRYTGNEEITPHKILILDTIGHLASAYLYADLAFIGGGFGKGLHNILEALAFGVPVVFGPETDKYPEAALAKEAGVAKTIRNKSDLRFHTLKMLGQADATESRAACIDFINWHSGASDTVFEYLIKQNKT